MGETGNQGSTSTSGSSSSSQSQEEDRFPIEYHVEHALTLYDAPASVVEALLDADRAKNFTTSSVEKKLKDYNKREFPAAPGTPEPEEA